MGMVFKKKRNSVKPVIKTKLFRKAGLSVMKPSVIEEAAIEYDMSSNNQERNKEGSVRITDLTLKVDNTEDRTHTYEKTVDSGTRNSYNLSESSHGSRQNGNNISVASRVISRTNSIPNSIHSSGRNSSVQSLTVIREQYCCCSKWTTCERILGTTVGIMAIIIVILVVVIGILSSNRSRSNFSGLTLTL